MSGTIFRFENSPYGSEFELVNEHITSEFSKYRLKSSKATVDIAVIELEDQSPEEFIKERKEDYQDMELRVPSPYTSEIETRKQDPDYAIDFHEDERIYGLSYAGPEYKIILDDGSQIPRYRYMVTWKKLENRTLEIELYIPKDSFELEKAFETVESITLNN